MSIHIRRLGAADAPSFEEALAIYREAIEPSEQRPEEELRALLARADYRVLAAERGGRVVGFAVSWAPKDEDFWLFEYAAMLKDERGRGTGTELFLGSGIASGINRLALVEVDAPETGEVAARRLGFYARLGCKVVEGLRYELPLRTNGVPPPMLMLALAPEEVASVPRDVVGRWLRKIYTDVYAQAEDDPRIALMMRPLPERVALTTISAPATP